MRYFLDTEFNSYKGQLISLALVRADFASLYLVFPRPRVMLPWIHENVMPYLDMVPKDVLVKRIMPYDAAAQLEEFLKGDDDIEIVVDWPDDIQYLSELLLTGAGQMIDIPRIRFIMERIDAWPLTDPSKYVEVFGQQAIQHNAWWDAIALRDKFFEVYPQEYPYRRQESVIGSINVTGDIVESKK